MSHSPFVFLEAVSHTKVDLFDQGYDDKDYTAFLVNRGLSYHLDTILYAAEMNMYSELPARLQFSYYFHSLKPRKRWAKWMKKEADLIEKEKLISRALSISSREASEIVDLFTDEQIQNLRERYDNAT